MLLGYNTNGLADHSLPAAIELVADLGYQSIAITVDHHTLNPYGDRLGEELHDVSGLLSERGLVPVIETGARYLLDARHKHQPTLVSMDRDQQQVRIDFLCRAVDLAAALDAACVSLWSGTALDEQSEAGLFVRLAQALKPVIEHAADRQVTLAFEPEPGHVVDTMAKYQCLLNELCPEEAEQLRLTIDVGHLHCQGEVPIAAQLHRWAERLENVHIEDMRCGIHDHLPFGEGEISFGPVLAALEEIGFAGPVTVELPRHSHIGPVMAEQSILFLRSVSARNAKT